MIAYNKQWLANLAARRQAEDVFDEGCIEKEELEAVYKKFPVGFYSPNVFIGMGLLLLTILILFFSFGLLALMFESSSERTFGLLAFFFAVISYTVLEFMARVKNHYSSGVDEGLLWMASIAVFSGSLLLFDNGPLANSAIIFVISLYGSLRYADRLMATLLYGSFIAILFYSCIEMGNAGKTIVPFLVMAASLISYMLVHAAKAKQLFINYKNCLTMIEITSLVSLYAAGNYFVVRELSNEMFHLNLAAASSIPFGWLFWIFSAIIPVIYILRGIQQKDAILIRVGLLLIAAIVFTVRYYYMLLPLETIMTIAGVLILATAYTLVKWLHEPVHGFTSRLISSKNETGKLQVESLIIAQTFKPGTDIPDSKFGGGSFGGGGASGDY